MTASTAHRHHLRQLTAWAWAQGYLVCERDVERDLAVWTDAYVAAHTPDHVLTVAEAAAELGVGVATVRRYLAPSARRLDRLDGGVSARSVEAYRKVRDLTLLRTRGTAPALRAA